MVRERTSNIPNLQIVLGADFWDGSDVEGFVAPVSGTELRPSMPLLPSKNLVSSCGLSVSVGTPDGKSDSLGSSLTVGISEGKKEMLGPFVEVGSSDGSLLIEGVSLGSSVSVGSSEREGVSLGSFVEGSSLGSLVH